MLQLKQITCNHCAYTWQSRSVLPWVTCPSCHQKTKNQPISQLSAEDQECFSHILSQVTEEENQSLFNAFETGPEALWSVFAEITYAMFTDGRLAQQATAEDKL